MDMDWYRTAERYIYSQKWPVRLKPILRENGLHFENENPLSPAGVLIIPSDWAIMPARLNTADSAIFRSDTSTLPRLLLQNSATLDMPIIEPKHLPSNETRVLVYNSGIDRRLYSRDVKIETNITLFASIVLGALPHGIMLFKDIPENKIYAYNADDIWMWVGNVENGLATIEIAIQQHVANGILLSWNQDLHRYLVIIMQPKKCTLDWEADFDKPNITQLFNEVNVDRILAYNSSTCLVFTMTVAAARVAVQPEISVI